MSSTELEVQQVTTALVEFDKVAAGLTELQKQYGGVVYNVRERKEMEAAKAARLAIRAPRYEVERLRKAAKAPILDLGKKLDSEAQRITRALLAIEEPIDEQIKNEEDRVRREAEERARVERERIEGLEARLDAIRTMPYEANGLGVADVEKILADARAMTIGDDWQEYTEKAKAALFTTVASLEGVLAKAQAAEAEKARIKAEREELARLRAEEAERKRQQESERRIQLAKEEAALKAEREAIAAERAKLAAEQAARIPAPPAEPEPDDVEPPEPAPRIQHETKPRPSDNEIIQVLMDHFKVERVFIEEWIADMRIRQRAGWQ